MPSKDNDVSFKSLCPFCPYDGGMSGGTPRSDNVRKHIRSKHKDFASATSYVDNGGQHMRVVAPNRVIKCKLVNVAGEATFKDAPFGFCFDCLTYIECFMRKDDSKVIAVRDHVCAMSLERGPRAGAGSGEKVKAPSQAAKIEAMFKDLKLKVKFNDDGDIDIAKSLRFNFTAGGGSDMWESLKQNKKLAPLALAEGEERDRADYAEDPETSDPFDATKTIAGWLLVSIKAQNTIAVSRAADAKRIQQLEVAADQALDEYELMERTYKDRLREMENGQKALIECNDRKVAALQAEIEQMADHANELMCEIHELKTATHLPAASSAACSAADIKAASASESV